jgi:hypothetical protein
VESVLRNPAETRAAGAVASARCPETRLEEPPWFYLLVVFGTSKTAFVPRAVRRLLGPDTKLRGSLPHSYLFTVGWQVVPARVVPFGDLRVIAC